MEKHLCDCIYAILHSTAPKKEKLPALQRYKAKLVLFYAALRNKILLDSQEHDKFEGEELFLFHVLRVFRHREVQKIWQVMDSHGNINTTFRDITANFVSYLSHKYHPVDVDGKSLATLQNLLHPMRPTTYAVLLEQTVISDELLTVLRAGARHKAPGIDGLSLEFYTVNCETIGTRLLQLLNHMFLHKTSPPSRKMRSLLSPQVYQPSHAK